MAGEPILIVDDNPTNLKLLAFVLTKSGYEVRCVAEAESALADPLPLTRLREVRTVGETVTEALREIVHRAWGVGLVDIYSLSECGLIALQCPVSGYFHVQSEWAVVEVLDAFGAPARPGGIGRAQHGLS